jgi:hypothetical protein
MTDDIKNCSKCKRPQPLSNYYYSNYHKRHSAKCKDCDLAAVKSRYHKKKGYDSSFNEALRQYAEVFNLPSLLRHIKNDPS